MSRYLERAEHTARLGYVCQGLTLDRSSHAVRRLMATVGTPPSGYLGPGIERRGAEREGGFDLVPCDAIAACVAAARENARHVREQISSEMWEQLNRLYLYLRGDQNRAELSAVLSEFYRYIRESSHLFEGVTDSTMTHGECWHYIQIGRFIERAATTATMLEVHFSEIEEQAGAGGIGYAEWVGLLRSCSAFEAYCRCYTADIRPERVAEFLLLNAEFPRSVRFAVDQVEASLRANARAQGRSAHTLVERLAGRLRASLDFSQIDEILADSLQSYVREIRKQCEMVDTALYRTYIAYPLESALP